MAQILDQAGWRQDRNVKDQFGRLWLVAFETGPNRQGGSGMPTGQIVAAGWSDPLGTPQQYIRVPKGEFGEYDKNRLVVDLVRWMRDQKEHEREWRQRFRQAGVKQYKSAFDPKEHAKDELLLDIVGPKPWPASDAIDRAAKGDRQYLGIEPLDRQHREVLGVETLEDLGYAPTAAYAEPNPALPPVSAAPPIETRAERLTWPQFTKKLKADGVPRAEHSALWEAYKAEVGAA